MGLTVTLTLSITLTVTLTLTLTHPAPYLQDGPRFNCAYYAKDGNCAKHGDSYANQGLTANMACCDCEGGVKSNQASPTGVPTDAPTTNAPTDAPRDAPTTEPPTDAPTESPTGAPTDAATSPESTCSDAPLPSGREWHDTV